MGAQSDQGDLKKIAVTKNRQVVLFMLQTTKQVLRLTSKDIHIKMYEKDLTFVIYFVKLHIYIIQKGSTMFKPTEILGVFKVKVHFILSLFVAWTSGETSNTRWVTWEWGRKSVNGLNITSKIQKHDLFNNSVWGHIT